jgi:hypothetical protein
MKRITITVPDDKYSFVLDLVKSLKFVQKVDTSASRISPGKAKFLKEFEEAIQEMKDIEAGKKKGKTMEEFLNEL